MKKICNDRGRRSFLKSGAALGALSALGQAPANAAMVSQEDDRAYWVQVLTRVAAPVLKALSERRLKIEMPVEAPYGNAADRQQFTYLEATGRLLAGIAPWLETGGRRPAQPVRGVVTRSDRGGQPVVGAGFLALAILRADNCRKKSLPNRHARPIPR